MDGGCDCDKEHYVKEKNSKRYVNGQRKRKGDERMNEVEFKGKVKER